MKENYEEIQMTIERGNEEFDVTVCANWYPGSPDVPYLANGDPGYPGWDPEVEILDVFGPNGEKHELSEEEELQAESLIHEEVADRD